MTLLPEPDPLPPTPPARVPVDDAAGRLLAALLALADAEPNEAGLVEVGGRA